MKASVLLSLLLVAAGVGILFLWPTPATETELRVAQLREAIDAAPRASSPALREALAAQETALKDSLDLVRVAEASNQSAREQLEAAEVPTRVRSLALPRSREISVALTEVRQRLEAADAANAQIAATEAAATSEDPIPFSDRESLEHHLDAIEAAMAQGSVLRVLVSGLLVCVPLLNVGLELFRKRKLDALHERKLELENRKIEIELKALEARLQQETADGPSAP